MWEQEAIISKAYFLAETLKIIFAWTSWPTCWASNSLCFCRVCNSQRGLVVSERRRNGWTCHSQARFTFSTLYAVSYWNEMCRAGLSTSMCVSLWPIKTPLWKYGNVKRNKTLGLRATDRQADKVTLKSVSKYNCWTCELQSPVQSLNFCGERRTEVAWLSHAFKDTDGVFQSRPHDSSYIINSHAQHLALLLPNAETTGAFFREEWNI